MAEVAGTTETITRTEPPEFVKPFLEYGMSEALRQYQEGPQQFFPGSTVAGFSPQQEQALRMQEQRALAGSPVLSSAQNLATQTLGGDFLGSNPYLQAAIDRALDPVQSRVMSGLSQRGRLGSGAATNLMAQTLGDVAGNISYQDYANERARMQQLIPMASSLAAADYGDISQLYGVGAARQGLAQQQLGSDVARFQFEQQAPYQSLGQYQNLISGFPMGQTGSAVQPYFDDSPIDYALAGGFLGSRFTPDSPSVGGGLGALAGYLLG